MFGLSANSAAAARAGAVAPKMRRAAAKRNNPAAMKQAADGIEPARPVRHSPLLPTNGSISACGSGSHTVPI